MRIAIVGAGVSGLTAAYLLNREHQIELYESADYLGGHAHTVAIDAGDREVGLDTGFIVYNEHTYPGFTKLLRDLHVGTKPGDMSISVSCRACRVQYSSRGLGGWLAQRGKAMRPGRALLAFDILRFYRDTRKAITNGAYDGATIDEFVRARRYSGEFVRHFLVPLASAVWSTPPGEIGAFPAHYFLRFLHNHGIIGLQPAFVWRTVEGGSQRYVAAMIEQFADRTHTSAPVRAISRDGDGATVMLANGTQERYDRVVVATHGDEALRLLTNASEEERAALSGFQYTTNRAVLHTDAALLPELRAARASWNYQTQDCRSDTGTLGMTYHLNRLQALAEPVEYCVTLNPHSGAGALPHPSPPHGREGDERGSGIRAETVIAEMQYEHPRYTFGTLAAQGRVEKLQGERRTFFAGAHLGYGFHEDGLQSGVRVARRFGIEL